MQNKGYVLSELLISIILSAIISIICLYGISAAINLVEAVTISSSADAFAGAVSEYIKNEIRFSRSPNDTIAELSDLDVSLNGIRANDLSFEKVPNGDIIFRFTAAGKEYSYSVTPLNSEYIEQ